MRAGPHFCRRDPLVCATWPPCRCPPAPGSPGELLTRLPSAGAAVQPCPRTRPGSACTVQGYTSSAPEGGHPATLPTPPSLPGGCKRCSHATVTLGRRGEPSRMPAPLPAVPSWVPGHHMPARRGPPAAGQRWHRSPAPAARPPPAAGRHHTPLPSPAGQHGQGHIGTPPK